MKQLLRSGCWGRVGWAVVWTGMALNCPHGLAQGFNRTATKFYPDFSDTADALLRNAASHAREGQWAEAVDLYQRVIQQFGDKVARLPKDDAAGDPSGESVLFVDLRQFCQRRLAALPPAGRAIYRSRVDVRAEQWYRQGAAERDRGLLRRVVEQAFCSAWGDDALELLGDLAFEDGRFDEALSLYRQLVPDSPGDRSGLIHPDPSVDLARVAAKKLLCRAAEAEDPPDRAALEAFAAAYPDAAGALAGRSGPYAETLAEALRLDHLAPPAQPDGRWPTFAGSPTRTKVVPGPIDVGSLQWRIELEAYNPNTLSRGMGVRAMGMSSFRIPDDRLLAYHPIVLGDQVVVCDSNRILAYDLNDRPTGPPGSSAGAHREAWKHDETQERSGPIAALPVTTLPRYTLTAFGDRIYARMGPTGPVHFGMGRMSVASPGSIIAVDRNSEGKLLWTCQASDLTLPQRPADGLNRSLGFEGTPVADARRVYVAVTDRRELTSTYVACLDAETGTPRWVRYLGAAPSEFDNPLGFGMGMGMGGGFGSPLNDFGHRLLSLDGSTVYYQTNLGAVAALDAETGGIRWVATYPREDRNDAGLGHERDLNPAIVHDGLVIVAPDDANSIYAFNAASGRLVWKTKPLPDEVKLAHVLGVAKGRLVATGDRVLLFDVRTGKLVQSWPDNGPAFEGFGRGLLAGDKIYWPTRNEIQILDQATGLRVEPSIKLQDSFHTTGGNLAVGDGYLIVAQADALVVFCQNSRLIQRYRDEIARAPDQASNYFRLARAAEATGKDELALEALSQALRRARPSESIDGHPLVEATRNHQYRLLMRLGRRARAGKEWARAAEHLEAATKVAWSDRDRLMARLALADVQLDRGTPRDAVVTLQGLLAEEQLRPLSVAVEEGHRTIRADLLIGDRLAAILKAHGRGLYEPFDRQARDLLERGQAQGDAHLLEEVGRSYPVALVVPDSLMALGQLRDTSNRPAEAAHAYKRLLAAAPGDALRARALLGLARAYEAQRLWVPARDTYTEILARFGDVTLEEFGTEARVAALVAERLAHEPFDRMMGDRSEPALPVPLVRRWGRPLPGAVRPLGAEGMPPSAEASRIFLVQGLALRAIDPASGEPLWSADLSSPPVWVGYLADKIIAATETRLIALSLDKGTIDWQYDLGGPRPGRRGENPFARPDPDAAPGDRSGGHFHHFQIVGDRVFCLRGDHELLAFDGDTGLVDWSFAPASGTINPNLWIGPQRIVLQVRKPGMALVLETATGRRCGEFPRSDDEDWARSPLPIDDDHVALVADRRTVALFDLRRGHNAWVFRESVDFPRNGPPRLLGDAERLLVVHDGIELIRLDPATGVKRWSYPLGIEDLSERPEAMALDIERFYWASNRTLNALRLAEGSRVWSRPLTGPESGWSIALTARCVMAYPVISGHAEGELESLPLVFRRRDSGELVQRLVFPVAVSEVAVRLAPRGALVAAQGGLWALGERAAMDASKFPR